MAEGIGTSGGRGSRWRIAGWGAAALLLLLPFLAMQVTTEMQWGGEDFLFLGVMLAVAGAVIEAAARINGNAFYRGGAIVAVAAAFLLVWVNVAVGFLGDEDHPANLMFAGVIAVALGGSIVARFRAAGMAKAMAAASVLQLLAGTIGLAAGVGSPGFAEMRVIVIATGLFGGLWLLSAWLFSKAATR